eukprot:g18899.t1
MPGTMTDFVTRYTRATSGYVLLLALICRPEAGRCYEAQLSGSEIPPQARRRPRELYESYQGFHDGTAGQTFGDRLAKYIIDPGPSWDPDVNEIKMREQKRRRALVLGPGDSSLAQDFQQAFGVAEMVLLEKEPRFFGFEPESEGDLFEVLARPDRSVPELLRNGGAGAAFDYIVEKGVLELYEDGYSRILRLLSGAIGSEQQAQEQLQAGSGSGAASMSPMVKKGTLLISIGPFAHLGQTEPEWWVSDPLAPSNWPNTTEAAVREGWHLKGVESVNNSKLWVDAPAKFWIYVMNQFLLHEDANGYALFQKQESEEIAKDSEQAQEAMSSFESFRQMVKLVAFLPFESAEAALAECKAIAGGEVTGTLETFLEMNLPSAKKKSTYQLGVYDPSLGNALNGKFVCNCGQAIKELLRACLMHFPKFIKDSKEDELQKARCGLAHCYSRDKMQLDPNRQDKPIMNVIAILDNLDKNINTFAMRVREWYAWHFPELTKIVNDNVVYAKVCRVIRIKEVFECDSKENLEKLTDACGDADIAQEIIKALQISMGQEIVEIDMENIENFAGQVVELAAMRQMLGFYLKRKMDIVAPNLASLVGEHVGARLISHAGSLLNLAKYPASTVQILGAEKALFRALKTKGNTPKYGLLYHSSFIGRAQQKNKGRISRYLANKCSIASRIDAFSDHSTKLYGERMKTQVEDRLSFLTEGVKPRKNLDVMQEAMNAVREEMAELAKQVVTGTGVADVVGGKKDKKSKKRKAEEAEVEGDAKKAKVDEAAEVAAEVGEGEKKKKKKKNKEEARAVEEPAPAVEKAAPAAEDGGKKKKKKKATAE